MTEHYGLTLVTAPTEEPLLLDEVRHHCRIDDDDGLGTDWIRRSITAARQYVETQTDRQLCTATYRLDLDGWPCVIRPPRPPLASVTSITYVDGAGATQTIDTAVYQVDTASLPGRILPAYGQVWPVERPQMGTIRVTYVAGYGTAKDVPDELKHAMLMLIGNWHENREATITGGNIAKVPMAVDAILQHHWSGEYS